MAVFKYEKTCALIRDLGIEPDHIAVDSFDTTGYDEIVFENNQKVIDPATGRAKRIRREWPSLAIGIQVVDQFIKDGGWEQ